MITTALTIILFLLILTLIVTVHEFGHFIAAKKFGVQVDEFSIGMGPLVVKKMWRGTQYSIRALPIGGYVKMLGEGESVNKPGSFSTAKAWKRLIIIYAGVAMNFVLVAFILTIIGIKTNGVFFDPTLDPYYTYPIGDSGSLKRSVYGVEQGSPADKAGVKSFDIINKYNGIDYKDPSEYSAFIGSNQGKNVKLELESYFGKDTKEVNVQIRDRDKDKLSDTQSNTGIAIGIPFVRSEFTGIAKPFSGILQTVNATHNYAYTLGYIVHLAFEHKDASIVANSVSSPVGAYAITSRVISLNGFWGVLTIIALLSLAIGLMNAIPFPALDGWHGVFIIGEILTKKKVNEKFYNAVTMGGFVILLGLGVLIIIKDILNYSKFF